MANTNKTKAEILQELESIKGLLLEEDDIPILQDTDAILEQVDQSVGETQYPPSAHTTHESILPGQGSLFDGEVNPALTTKANTNKFTHQEGQLPTAHEAELEVKKQGIPAGVRPPQQQPTPRTQVKATGENPFLPQHIRERLHGNNPPPLFEYETAKKIISATKIIAPQTITPKTIAPKTIVPKISNLRQHLVDDLVKSVMPQIERELRHRLFAMSVEDLEKLLNEEDD